MERAIFEVYAKVIDANGNYNTLSGYPKAFDSKNYDNDVEKARNRAYAEYHSCLGSMFTRDDRKVQFAMIIDASTGWQIEVSRIGELNDPEVIVPNE